MKLVSTSDLILLLHSYRGDKKLWSAEELEKVIVENFGSEWYYSRDEGRMVQRTEAKINVEDAKFGWED